MSDINETPIFDSIPKTTKERDRYFEALHRIVQGDWDYQQCVSIAREAITPKEDQCSTG